MPEKFDYKKEYKDLYLPKTSPSLVEVPTMSFIMVDGEGDPNIVGGSYETAVGLLYALSYTIKMSKMTANKPEGYFEYVVAPLEGFWHYDRPPGTAPMDKSKFTWTSMIRQPDFVTLEAFETACKDVETKKGIDVAPAYLKTFTEGLCVQALHIGPYDNEPETVAKLEAFALAQGLVVDISQARRHHEIYLSDPRKTAPEKLKTVLRIPVRKNDIKTTDSKAEQPVRSIGEDDDGYDPYSDYSRQDSFYEPDPWR